MERTIIPDFMILLKKIGKKPVCATDLQTITNMTYSYIHSMKKYMLKKKWISIYKKGRRHNMHITEKGLEVIKAIDSLLDVLDIDVEEVIKYRRRRKESSRKKKAHS